ncbi:MAG TPA: ABC transporter ATP-binding protein [Gammaproteobacteria bacterium]|nr:ABC transporter ATP-binding protein [Gammaproteobacteria bacterium]
MRKDLPTTAITAVPAESAIAIQCRDLTKIYRLYASQRERVLDELGLYRWLPLKRRAIEEFKALDAVSMTIRRGERVGVVGRNGAGKTTLLKLITGNFAPTSGEITVNGKVQALMQTGLGFHPEFSGYQNICSSLLYNGLLGDDFEAALEDVVKFVELGEFLHQPMNTYSQGMQARVQFAAATAIKPDVLIIDEILGAGDAYFSAKSSVRMESLAHSGCTLLLVSHSMPQVLQFCDRAVWIEKGKVIMEGNSREIVGSYEVACQEQVIQAVWSSSPIALHGDGKHQAGETTPRYANKDWIAKRIDPQMLLQRDHNVKAFSIMLENGKQVFRWPSNVGVKILNIEISCNGVSTTNFTTGGSMQISIKLRAEMNGEFRCRYYVSIFGLDGRRLAWITSSVDFFKISENEVRFVTVQIDPLLLGAGDYILSFSVFDDTDPREINTAKRFDLLARCIEFHVTEIDGRESPVFHHPARWEFGSSLNASK